jgi:16S rRNA (cytosine967-C5)-methyltransferase
VYILYTMNRFYSYINTTIKLIETYKGDQPFAIFIKSFFSKEKKYGSKDRKQIAALCYNYFRLGFAMPNYSAEEKIKWAVFLCDKESTDFAEKIIPDWSSKIDWPTAKKLELIKDQFSVGDIFPFGQVLSEGIIPEMYCQSMLAQPLLFLRIRPQCKVTTLKKLEKSKLDYRLIESGCIQLPAAVNAEDFFIIDKEVVVQDYNSQRVLNYLQLNETTLFGSTVGNKGITTWDCCAASGGKSILLLDTLKHKIDLTISDIRPGIVMNLHQRFKRAGVKQYNYFIADVGDTKFSPPASDYELIICDAPCTGSGTWSRTPEQLSFFNLNDLEKYSGIQKRIAGNVVPHLKKDGIFVYITCSVFKEENEAVASFIRDTLHLNLLHQEILKGFDRRADNMFVAVFKKEDV